MGGGGGWLSFCFNADDFSVNLTSDKFFSFRLFGYPLVKSRNLNFSVFSSNVVFEEFVHRSLSASP